MPVAIRITDGRSSLWRYDTGVTIKIIGATNADECHFETPQGVIKRDVDPDCIVSVPDAALLNSGLMRVYVYDRTDSGAVTRNALTMLVNDRPKPTDYIDPPDEYDNLSELAKRVAPLIPGGGGEPVTPE